MSALSLGNRARPLDCLNDRLARPVVRQNSVRRQVIDLSALSSRLVGSLRHDHPLKPPEEGVDVKRAPVSPAAIHFSWQDQPTSLGVSSVKDYVNVGVTGELCFSVAYVSG
jgi:hypothetical protein